MPKSLINEIQALLDEHGWSEFLTTLADVARADGFVQLADAIEPLSKLLTDGDINGHPQ